MEPVFVYGTLKQNQPNNYHLNDTKNGCAVFRSVAVTVNKYPLVISTRFNIPFLLQNEGTGNVSNFLYNIICIEKTFNTLLKKLLVVLGN